MVQFWNEPQSMLLHELEAPTITPIHLHRVVRIIRHNPNIFHNKKRWIFLNNLIYLTDESFLGNQSGAVVPFNSSSTIATTIPMASNTPNSTMVLPQKKAPSMAKPKWHAPWKLYRVISGHLGWVRCCAVEPGNEWFATGSADRVIKVIKINNYSWGG